MDSELSRCEFEQAWMVSHFGPMRDSKLDHIGHMDWLIEELMIREEMSPNCHINPARPVPVRDQPSDWANGGPLRG